MFIILPVNYTLHFGIVLNCDRFLSYESKTTNVTPVQAVTGAEKFPFTRLGIRWEPKSSSLDVTHSHLQGRGCSKLLRATVKRPYTAW
jgi:hypothetical protein